MAKKCLMMWYPKRACWQKRYRGKLYQVSCRQLKQPPTKEGSLDAANLWWEAKQKELDVEEAPPPLTRDQKAIIGMIEWQEFHAYDDPSTVAFLKEISQDPQKATDYLNGLPEEQRAKWRDRRIEQMRFKTNPRRQEILEQITTQYKVEGLSTTLEKVISQYLAARKREAETGQITLGRWDYIRLHLTHFQEYTGAIDPKTLGGQQLFAYHGHLLDQIKNKKVSPSTAKSAMTIIKTFYGWLDDMEIIDRIPKNMKKLTITVPTKKAQTLSVDFIKTLLQKANDREKLYLLLMLNCGYTQADIAALQHDEVDWLNGAITRKRSKTDDYDNVPTVRYPLWKETFRLLKIYRNRKSPTVLTNEDGGPLKTERVKTDGKYTKADNIAVSYYRLCKREPKIEQKPLKLIRKTSSTLLEYNKDYHQFALLFLGHSPRGIAEKHYFGDAPATFADAIKWLGNQYGIQ